MAKKKSKSKQAGKQPKPEPEAVLFGWREPRKRSICRPSSAYRFLADLNGRELPNLTSDELYLYLGSIPNRPGRCTAIELSTGRVIVDNHPEDFEEVPPDEA